MKKCCMKGCDHRGFPAEGYDFYLCGDCMEEIERRVRQEWVRRYERHANN